MLLLVSVCCDTRVVAGVSVLWHRCCCWCQCVVTRVLLLVSVCCGTGVVAGVSVLWHSPSLGVVACVSVLWTGVVAGVSVLWQVLLLVSVCCDRCCWCQCVVTGVVVGVSVLWHRCCCWCQCVVAQVLLLVSVCWDTAQALVLLLVSVCYDTGQAIVLLLVSVCCDTGQAIVLLLVSVCCDTGQAKAGNVGYVTGCLTLLATRVVPDLNRVHHITRETLWHTSLRVRREAIERWRWLNWEGRELRSQNKLLLATAPSHGVTQGTFHSAGFSSEAPQFLRPPSSTAYGKSSE